MKKTYKNHSIFTITASVVIGTVAIIMAVFLYYNYHSIKKDFTNEFEKQSHQTINRLKISLEHFISSYSINEYNKLLITEMSNENIQAIIIEDYVTGKILSQDAYISGKQRDKQWNIKEFTQTNKKPKEYFFKKTSNILSSDTTVGKITIYYTDKFLEQKLDEMVIKSLVTIFAISVLLIISLFIALNRVVLIPLKHVIASIEQKDQELLPKELNIKSGSKEIVLLSEVFDDMIKKIKVSKEKLKKLNERFELTLDAVNDGIWDWDLVSDRAYYSKRWKSMLGYKPSEIKNKGTEFFRLLHKDYQAITKEAIEKHFQSPDKNPYNIEIKLKCKDGSYKWILSRGKAILNEKGEAIRMLGYHSDITHEKENEKFQKRQESIMNQQSKLASMGEMIGNIAHQWRQPLSVISTAASGIKLKQEYDSLDKKFLFQACDSIVYQTQFLSKTIDDFKNFIKGDSKPVTFKLNDTIESFLKVVESSIKKYSIQVILNVEKNLEIKSYPNELIQCLINLFNNSKDALLENKINEEERFIFITAIIKEDKLYLSIKDNANGISKAILPKVFEPYFTTKHQSQGTGLGLHMTYNLITKGLKGTIAVSNKTYTHNNKNYTGANFIIELPLSLSDS